ncbi:MAG: hypothetical protein IPI73_30100 [Betaproteobacteria bacterium]|nr:hypothetical protein [Betaproteobacteria bacterium]
MGNQEKPVYARTCALAAQLAFACVSALCPIATFAAEAELPTLAQVRGKVSGIGVPFIENAGQFDARVKFAAPTFVGTLFVTHAGDLVYALAGNAVGNGKIAPARSGNAKWTAPHHGRDLVLTETFFGGHAEPQAGLPSVTNISSFINENPVRHQTHVRTFETVALGEVFPDIQVHLRAAGRNVEKIFTVGPHGNPDLIRLELAGAEWIDVDKDGRLVVGAAEGQLAFSAPVAFQTIQGRRNPVPVAYRLEPERGRYGFAVGTYDRAQPLIIDPLLQATYLGGSSQEIIRAIAVHPATGEVLVAGTTSSTDLPCTTAGGGCGNGAQIASAGSSDGFIARLSADLTNFLQITYLGGSGSEEVYAVSVHPVSGEVLVAGSTLSTNLPCTVAGNGCSNGAQPTYAGGITDGFVARLDADLTSLLQVTYLGGTNVDYATALAVHPVTGDVLAGGATASAKFPCTSSVSGCGDGAQSVYAGGYDGFVARLSPDLTTFLQATYVGGTSGERVSALAVHPVSGEVLAAGNTQSTDLPCTTNSGGCSAAAQPGLAGPQNGFVARLNPSLTSLLQATYLGGSSAAEIGAVAVHPMSGEVLVAGTARSTNLPCTQGGGNCGVGAQPTNSWSPDGFVARINANLTILRQVTYLGGSFGENIHALAIHPVNGQVLVAGETGSADFPCTTAIGRCGNGAQTTPNGLFDAFVARLNPDLTAVLQATYFGGNQGETIYALTVSPMTGEVLVAGSTGSTNLPVRRQVGLQRRRAAPAHPGGVPGRFPGATQRRSGRPACATHDQQGVCCIHSTAAWCNGLEFHHRQSEPSALVDRHCLHRYAAARARRRDAQRPHWRLRRRHDHGDRREQLGEPDGRDRRGKCVAPSASTSRALRGGVKSNTTAAITATEAGVGATSNTVTITVVTPLTIAKAFGAAAIPLNGSTSLTIVIQNPNATVALTGVAFTDTLPAGLEVATPNAMTNSCGGTATATAGSGAVSLANGAIVAGGSCAVSISVTGVTAGDKNNTTGSVASTNGGSGTSASATTTVVAPPTIAKSFMPATIVNGARSTL